MPAINLNGWSYDFDYEKQEAIYTVNNKKVTADEFCNELAEQQYKKVRMLTDVDLKRLINTSVKLGTKVKTEKEVINVIAESLKQVYRG